MTAAGVTVLVNGERQTLAAQTVGQAIEELGFGAAKVATALNGAFVPATGRASAPLADGDRLEIVSARQGG
jgi:sulfur carrier protein